MKYLTGTWKWKFLHNCLHYGWYWKKNIQFGILVILEAQEINLAGNL